MSMPLASPGMPAALHRSINLLCMPSALPQIPVLKIVHKDTFAAGGEYRSRLLAMTDMPKPATGLNVDFGSFIGPLFFVWLVQLPLPWVRPAGVCHSPEPGWQHLGSQWVVLCRLWCSWCTISSIS